MNDQWEPGTVALIRDNIPGQYDYGIGVRVAARVFAGEPVWMLLTNGPHARADGGFVRDENVTDVRPLIVLNLSPHELLRTLEALREGRGYIAGQVADKLEAAAPHHLAVIAGTEVQW